MDELEILKKTLIIVEDKYFYKHWGIDPGGIVRAFFVNLSLGKYSQGGSTITQQLARTLYLHNRKTLRRKILEIIIAFYLEVKYSKQEILDMYIGSVYMGCKDGYPILGFKNAAHVYFGKKLNEISILEQAALVAMVKGPNVYKTKSHLGTIRRMMVLGKMFHNKIIDQNTYFDCIGVSL